MPLFIDSTAEKGIRHTQMNGSNEKRMLVEAKGAGVSVADIDGDGWEDLYFINGMNDPENPNPSPNRIYRNRGDGTFVDLTESSGLGIDDDSLSAVFADYDNDGDLDCYLCNFGKNRLLRNDGNFQFQDVTEQAGTGHDGLSTAAAFGDVDLDGDLDLYICQYAEISYPLVESLGTWSRLMGQKVFLGPLTFTPSTDVLYINEGNGTFTDGTVERGIKTWEEGRGLGVRFVDFDGDGDLDIFVGNDMTSDTYYLNRGNGYFEENALLSGLGYNGNGDALATMGVVTQDIDGDLDQDLFLTGYEGELNTLYSNDGKGMFQDVTAASRAGINSKLKVSFGAVSADFDRDSDMDLFVTYGHVYPAMDKVEGHPGYAQQNQLLCNNGKGTFIDITNNAGEALLRKNVSRGAAVFDFDRDGDVDIVINNLDDKPVLLENKTETDYGWIQVDARNEYGSPAVGSGIEVVMEGRSSVQYIFTSDSFLSQSSPVLHFGLGKSGLKGFRIHWLGGKTEWIDWTKPNHRIRIQRDKNGAPVVSIAGKDLEK